MQVNQILPSIDYGDAVSNDAVSIGNMLKENGYKSTIYAKYIHPKMAGKVKELTDYKGDPDNILIYHFSLAGEDVSELVKRLPDKKILMYHNITPPEFFIKYDDMLALKCEKGLREIQSFPAYFNTAIGKSEFSRHELEKMGFKKTYALPVLIDFDRLKDQSGHIRNDIVKILFVGRISPNKKIEDIIKIFYYYHNFINKNSSLSLVGKEQMPIYKNELKELLDQLDMCDSVEFTGQVNDESLAWHYREADVFLCMSEHEGFCVPIVEAMQFNLPIIAFNSSAIPDTLGGSGVLANVKDYKKIAELMDIVIRDTSIRNSIVSKQKDRLKDFDPANVSGKLTSIIEEVSRNGHKPPAPATNSLTPKVSIVICTYNRGTLLKRCLDSLYRLDYPDFEIIVVDGPSTDNTEAILAEYPGVKKIRQEALNGLSYARNLGIKASSGEIIAFIDDDAVADINWLKYLIGGYMDSSVGGVGGQVFDITGQWYQFKNGYVSKNGISTFNNEYDMNYNDPKGPNFNYIMGANSSFRKDVLFDVGLFDENIRFYLDETDVCVRVIKKGYKIVHSPHAKVLHEMAEGHNRKSQYDVNYREIMKNVVYFTIKNFGNEMSSYTVRPARSVAKWVIDDAAFLKNGKVTIGQFMGILIKVLRGAGAGYVAGLKYKFRGA